MSLSRDEILSKTDLPKEKVKAWGDDVWVRTMRADERDRYDAESIKARGPDKEANLIGMRARLVVFTVCNEAGDLLFKPEDAEAVGQLNAKDVARVFDTAMKLNALSASDVEELAKN